MSRQLREGRVTKELGCERGSERGSCEQKREEASEREKGVRKERGSVQQSDRGIVIEG